MEDYGIQSDLTRRLSPLSKYLWRVLLEEWTIMTKLSAITSPHVSNLSPSMTLEKVLEE